MDYNLNVNLHLQLMQREMGVRFHNSPKAFTAHLYRERYRVAKNLYSTDLRAHYGCVNAIEFSHGGKYLASGGDDKRVLIWDVEKAISNISKPHSMETEHTSNIFCLGFDSHNKNVFSGGNDDLVIAHDFATLKLVNVFKHDNPVYGLSIDSQNDNIFATACEDGQILIFDMRVDPADPLVLAQMRTSFHAVEFHPTSGYFLVTANSKSGAAFWDIRKPNQPIIQYGYPDDPPSCMSVRFNRCGNLVLALRRRLPPILYNTQSTGPVCTFYHSNYYNSCTMKSCTFAGEDDELVISGSDDFNLYIWRISDVDYERVDQWIETTQMVLYGHRSIVNQVRYNRQKCLLASSGVEKIVKLWSPFAQNKWTGSLLTEAISAENPRELYSPYNLSTMTTPPHSWSHMSHDYSSRNTNEDPRMMAFFDSLIQQEIEGWETDSSTDSHHSNGGNFSTTDTTDSSCDDDDNDDGNGGAGRERVVRRSKRVLIRKKERKARKGSANKIRIQRHKFANRIAYLIATKRNALRRLAIKGAARYPHKIIRVGQNAKTTGRLSDIVRAAMGSKRNTLNSTMSSTSTGAGTSSRVQRRKYKRNRAHDTTSDENDDPSKPSSSNRFTSTNNEAVPSTSTGITSSLKDDIIRLRRHQQHIIDSDEDDDDDDDQPTTSGALRLPEVVVDPTVQPTKKLNGVRRSNDAAALERSRRTEAANMHGAGVAQQHQIQLRQILSDATSPTNTNTMLPQSMDNHTINNGIGNNTITNRRRPHADYVDNYYSSHSNSRLSNSSYQDDILDMDSSDSSTNDVLHSNRIEIARQTEEYNDSKHSKRRKLTEYINTRIDMSDTIEENNNEQNNNDIFPTTSHHAATFSNSNIQVSHNDDSKPYHKLDSTPHKESDGRNSHYDNFTPDSGISMLAMTPNPNSSCFSEDSNGVGHPITTTNGNGEAASTSKSGNEQKFGNLTNKHKHAFQQKVARVRRNYRRKFADDSDSD